MTLSSETERVSYSGDGSTASFSVPFVFWSLDDLEVILRASDGAETVWTRGNQYSVTGGSGSTGTVTVSTSPTDYTPASGTKLVIRSSLTLTQDLSLTSGGTFPSTSIAQQFDKLVRMIQQANERAGRAIRFPATDSSSLSALLPASSARASKFLAFDADGNPVASAGSADTVTVSTFMATVLDDLTAAAARLTLGISIGTTVDKYVEDYGAVGDGSTDDTAAFATAIAALTAGDVLRLSPNKTYILDGTTSLNVASVTLDCRGATIKLKATAGNNAKLLTVAADDVKVIGGTFNGNASNEGAATGQALIYHTGRSRVHIDVEKMTNSLGYGFYGVDATDCSVRAKKVDTCANTGIQWLYTGANSLTRCLTWDSYVDRSDSAAYTDPCISYGKSGAATGAIVGCAILNCRGKADNAASLDNLQIWGVSRQCSVIGCHTEGGIMGISVANGGTKCTVAGNAVYDFGNHGIEIADSTYCTVSGNVIDGNGTSTKAGVSLDGSSIAAVRNVVVGNTILGVKGQGVSLYLTVTGCAVIGNTIYVTDAAADGIYFNGCGACDVAVDSNNIDGAGTANIGIRIVQSYNISGSGNVITNWVAQAIGGNQNAAGTMNNISFMGGLIASTSGVQFLSSGGGALGSSIQFRGIAGLLDGTAAWDQLDYKNDVKALRGSGSPEGVYAAGINSTYDQTDGAPGAQRWYKESGTGNTGWRKFSNPLTVEVTVGQADLATAGTKTLIAAISGAKFKLRNIRLSGSGTTYSGGGGDRKIAIQDSSGTTVWTVMERHLLASLWPTDWGRPGLPFPATVAQINAESTAGEAIVAKYSGGTTDYTAGSITLILEYERTT